MSVLASPRGFLSRLLCATALAATPPVLGMPAADGELAEVVVTATLRAMPEWQVPGSVTVLDAATLRGAGGQHLEDVLAMIPNLNWAGDSSRPRYFQLRGIGELEQYEGAPNPSVGFVIDDMDFSGLGSAATLFDIDSVQVLRGPQATRFGANALAGLIYVTSAAPEKELAGYAAAEAGSYATGSLGGVLTAPVPELDSAFRLAAQRYRNDGYYYNDYLRRHDTDKRDELTLRGRWRYDPSAALRLDVVATHLQLDNGYDAFSPENGRTTHSDHPGVDAQHSSGLSAHLSYSGLDARTLTAIASYLDTRSRYGYDGDWGNANYWAPYTYDFTELQSRHRRTATAELRLQSDRTAGFNWLVGGYARQLRESLEDASVGLSIDPINGRYSQDLFITSAYRSTNLAVYGELGGELASRLHWTLGARGEHHAASYRQLIAGNAAPTSFQPSEALWGGSASLSYDLATNATSYLQLARGYKAGGFNLSQGLEPAEIVFRPESDLNLEAGYKSQPAGGRWSLATSVFVLLRQNAQIKSSVQTDPLNPNTFVLYTGNAVSGTDYGLETAGRWAWTPRLTLGASLGLLRTWFHDFVRIAGSGSTSVSRELANAPHWQAAVNWEYRSPRGLYARLDITGMGGYYFDLPPNLTRSSRYALVHARLGWDTPRWSAFLWGRNLTNHDYPVRGFYFGLEPPRYENKLYVQLGDPRAFGANLTIRFGATTSGAHHPT